MTSDVDSSGDSTRDSDPPFSHSNTEQPSIKSMWKAAVKAREQVSEWTSILRAPPGGCRELTLIVLLGTLDHVIVIDFSVCVNKNRQRANSLVWC